MADARPALHDAASGGDEASARALLAGGAAVDARDAGGATALHAALEAEDAAARLAVAALLLGQGADANASDDKGDRPLHLAARRGDCAAMRLLLDGGARVGAFNRSTEHATHAAVAGGHADALRLLFERGADPGAPNKKGYNVLHAAARLEDPDASRAVMAAVLERRDVRLDAAALGGWSAVEVAERANLADSPGVAMLRERVAELGPVASRSNWQLPLHVAAKARDLAAVEELLDGGARIDAGDLVGASALHHAVTQAWVEGVELLLARGASAMVRHARGQAPLHFAWGIENEATRLAVATLLLDSGADPDGPCMLGLTPLARCKAEVDVELLLQRGADPEIANLLGQTALHWTSKTGHPGAVRALLKGGARHGAVDWQSGATPLHLATTANKPEVARLLLQHGADANATNADGLSPLAMLLGGEPGDHDDDTALHGLALALLAGGARMDTAGAAAAARIVGMAPTTGDVKELVVRVQQAGAVVDTAEAFDSIAKRVASVRRNSLADPATRALLAMVPDKLRAGLVHGLWCRNQRLALVSPGALAMHLEAGARWDETPYALSEAAGQTDKANAAALIRILLEAGARENLDHALLELVWLTNADPYESDGSDFDAKPTAYEIEADAAEAAHLLLAHGADPECTVGETRESALRDTLHEAIGQRAAAVRDTMLRCTGDRDATRLVLAFFSALTPLDVPLGELLPADDF